MSQEKNIQPISVFIMPPEETNEIPSDFSVPGLLIYFSALLLVFPLYLFILWYYSDTPPNTILGPQKSSQNSVNMVSLPEELDFQPLPPMQPIKSAQEFCQNLLFICETKQEPIPEVIHFRFKSLEHFSEYGMDSKKSAIINADFPNFNLSKERNFDPKGQQLIVSINFLKNFDAVLFHPPALEALGGPQEYFLYEDGSIQFPETISQGDTYEIAALRAPNFNIQMKVSSIPPESPYLACEYLDTQAICEISEKAIAGSKTPAEKALAIGSYIEKTSVYHLSCLKPPKGVHPVVDFLTRTKEGYCQHFAASVVLLCRIQGIGARAAVGYLAKQLPPPNENKFTSMMGHAWAEILTEEGWAVIDPAVSSRIQEANRQLAGFPPPTPGEISQLLKKAREAKPQRAKNPRFQNGQAQPAGISPETPGKISQNPELMRRHAERLAALEMAKLKKWLLSLILLSLIVFILWKFNIVRILWNFFGGLIKRFLRWLLSSKKPKSANRDPVAIENERLSLLNQLNPSQKPHLTGEDIVQLFNRFAALMGDQLSLPRLANETPCEYVQRFCGKLQLESLKYQYVNEVFEKAFYGTKKISGIQIQQFREGLTGILTITPKLLAKKENQDSISI